jgi:hypothetical protein
LRYALPPAISDPTKPFSPYRGGAAALSFPDVSRIVGWGHCSLSFDVHTPFRFRVEEGDRIKGRQLYIEPVVGLLSGINDPTSFWIDPDGTEKVTLCQTPHRWSVTQPCEAVLYNTRGLT